MKDGAPESQSTVENSSRAKDESLCLLQVYEEASALKEGVGSHQTDAIQSIDFLAYSAELACKHTGANPALPLSEAAFDSWMESFGEDYISIEQALNAEEMEKAKALPAGDKAKAKELSYKYGTLMNYTLIDLTNKARALILPPEE